MNSANPSRMPPASVDRIYREWDEALANNDVAALLALYAPDAVLESPLVPHLMGGASGVLRGHEELRPFIETVARRKPEARRFYRTANLTDGARLVWEYPRAAAEGEQMDFVEVMEVGEDGLIYKHRVYWGWFGVLSQTPGPPRLAGGKERWPANAGPASFGRWTRTNAPWKSSPLPIGRWCSRKSRRWTATTFYLVFLCR